jgi:uncharacterized hydantoinase/oxoprolinase family protein
MLCLDGETCTEKETRDLARDAAASQIGRVCLGLDMVMAAGRPGTVVLAGAGEFLAEAALSRRLDLSSLRVVSLAQELGPALSQAACAHAVAVLAAEGE